VRCWAASCLQGCVSYSLTWHVRGCWLYGKMLYSAAASNCSACMVVQALTVQGCLLLCRSGARADLGLGCEWPLIHLCCTCFMNKCCRHIDQLVARTMPACQPAGACSCRQQAQTSLIHNIFACMVLQGKLRCMPCRPHVSCPAMCRSTTATARSRSSRKTPACCLCRCTAGTATSTRRCDTGLPLASFHAVRTASAGCCHAVCQHASSSGSWH
jgi:hypothetical protein